MLRASKLPWFPNFILFQFWSHLHLFTIMLTIMLTLSTFFSFRFSSLSKITTLKMTYCLSHENVLFYCITLNLIQSRYKMQSCWCEFLMMQCNVETIMFIWYFVLAFALLLLLHCTFSNGYDNMIWRWNDFHIIITSLNQFFTCFTIASLYTIKELNYNFFRFPFSQTTNKSNFLSNSFSFLIIVILFGILYKTSFYCIK